ncbi:MAG: DNA cytosine methyltransferase, partial [Bacilli bacterium]
MKKLKVLELFAGTRSIGKQFEAAGHEVYSVEWDKQHHNIDLYIDINELTTEMVLEKFGRPDIIWASPDCTTYSIAAISHHRIKEDNTLSPKSDYANFSDKTNKHVLRLIKELQPKYYFIENPRGGMRKMDF